jgi:retinol dehydrogenase 12
VLRAVHHRVPSYQGTNVMQGKTVIITGATNGIGEVTARELARRGARVVIISRSADRCRATTEAIQQATGSQQVEYIAEDLSSMAGVRRAADTFKATHQRLDVLLNNAGAVFTSYAASADGFEMTLALNHLNYFLLTNELLPMLKTTATQTGDVRVVNVASAVHSGVKRLDVAGLPTTKEARFGGYSNSKLMNILFTYELAERLAGTGITVNALHPGVVRSGFGKNNGALVAMVFNLLQGLGGISAEQGAETSIHLAASAEVKGMTGKYFDKKQPVSSSPLSYDRDLRQRLWAASEKMTGLSALV